MYQVVIRGWKLTLQTRRLELTTQNRHVRSSSKSTYAARTRPISVKTAATSFLPCTNLVSSGSLQAAVIWGRNSWPVLRISSQQTQKVHEISCHSAFPRPLPSNIHARKYTGKYQAMLDFPLRKQYISSAGGSCPPIGIYGLVYGSMRTVHPDTRYAT